jgi:hypothetical protein
MLARQPGTLGCRRCQQSQRVVPMIGVQLTFSCVCCCQSLEHSPLSSVSVHYPMPTASSFTLDHTHRNSHQNSPSHKRLDVLRKERDEDEPNHRNQRPDHRKPVAIPLSNNTIDKQTQNLANPSSIRKPTLPRCSDLEFAGLVLDAELLVERWKCEE